VSTVIGWSDSRKRSRFTCAAGPAATPLPLADLRRIVDEMCISTASQICPVSDGAQSAGTADCPSQRAASIEEKPATAYRRLDEIREAQQRLADGSYGACCGCGRPVSLSRLQAFPCTRYCLACAMRHTEIPLAERSPDSVFPVQRIENLLPREAEATTERDEYRNGGAVDLTDQEDPRQPKPAQWNSGSG
jgi:RNA polymerase-binding transcription factor DksA